MNTDILQLQSDYLEACHENILKRLTEEYGKPFFPTLPWTKIKPTPFSPAWFTFLSPRNTAVCTARWSLLPFPSFVKSISYCFS